MTFANANMSGAWAYVRHIHPWSSSTGKVLALAIRSMNFERILDDGTKANPRAGKVGMETVLNETQVGDVDLEIDTTTLSPSYSRSSTSQDLEIWEVTYTPAAQDVYIPRGENAGRTLPHLNVVKDMKRIGYLERGRKQRFRVEAQSQKRTSHLEGKVLIVQDGKGGEIVGVLKV